MQQSVIKQVTQLHLLDLEQLHERWRALFGSEPQSSNKQFLIKRLAYRIQEIAFGGLTQTVKTKMNIVLEKNAFDEYGRPSSKKQVFSPDKPIAGTQFIREWKGVEHHVTVLRDGFEYQGRRYKSLSAIARSITGTQWNGPLFFGLRSKRKVTS